MITNLNQTVKALEQQVYEDIPKGRYTFVVDTIDPWEKKEKKNEMIILRDENGYALKDEKGRVEKEKVDHLEFYTANIKLKIIRGQFANRTIFASLTTHPNAVFVTQGFLYAVGEDELPFSEIPTVCKGKELDGQLEYREYETTKVDKNTGVETTETRRVPNITKFLRPELIDDGI